MQWSLLSATMAAVVLAGASCSASGDSTQPGPPPVTPPVEPPSTNPGPLPTGPGSVETVPSFHSATLGNSRTIRVYLPPEYAANPSRRYPVLYMQDGASAFGAWGLAQVADAEINAGRIRPLIIVAVDAVNRDAEYTWVASTQGPGLAADYRLFLITELLPYINSHYRTDTAPASTGIGGASLGGIVSGWVAATRPDVFGMAVCMSTSFLVGGRTVETLLAGDAPGTVRLYVSRGLGSDGSASQPASDRQLIATLASRGWRSGVDMLYETVPGAGHDDANWASRGPDYLRFLFGI